MYWPFSKDDLESLLWGIDLHLRGGFQQPSKPRTCEFGPRPGLEPSGGISQIWTADEPIHCMTVGPAEIHSGPALLFSHRNTKVGNWRDGKTQSGRNPGLSGIRAGRQMGDISDRM